MRVWDLTVEGTLAPGGSLVGVYRGTSLKRNFNPPYDHHRALCTCLLQHPKRKQFLMNEVPL